MPKRKMGKVILYTKRNCPDCIKRKHELKKMGIRFEERNIEFDDTYLFEMVQHGEMSVPFEVYPWKYLVVKIDKIKNEFTKEEFDKWLKFMNKIDYNYFVLNMDEALARDLRNEYFKKTLRGNDGK